MAKIPVQAKKVFSGVIFDVYQWEQEMFDGTHETFEVARRQNGCDVIAIKEGMIMVQEQEQPNKSPFMSLPGGRVELGEKPLDGAKREMLEETGHVSDDWTEYFVAQPTSKLDWTIYTYIARDCRYQQKMELDAGEKIKLKWVNFDELIELVDTGKLKQLEQDFRMELVRAKYHKLSYEKLKKQIFGG